MLSARIQVLVLVRVVVLVRVAVFRNGEDPGFGEYSVHPRTPDPPASPNTPRQMMIASYL